MAKRAPSAYNFLTMDKELRHKIKTEHPDWVHADIMAEYARLWKSFTNEQKQPYVDKATQAKKEFVPPVETGEMSEEKKVIQVKKRAKTAFIFYLYDPKIREEVKAEHPDFKPKDYTSHISKMWKALSDEDKKPWEEMSKKQKQEYLENPVYEEKVVKTKKTVNQVTVDRAEQLEMMVKDLKRQVDEIKALFEEKLATMSSPQVSSSE